MVAAFAFNSDSLPDGLRFDGIMAGDGRDFLQFTETDETSPSYGASFYLDSRAALLDSIIARRAEKRAEFALGEGEHWREVRDARREYAEQKEEGLR